jgi:hypothetical protein
VLVQPGMQYCMCTYSLLYAALYGVCIKCAVQSLRLRAAHDAARSHAAFVHSRPPPVGGQLHICCVWHAEDRQVLAHVLYNTFIDQVVCK